MNDAELPDQIRETPRDVDIALIPQESRGRVKGDFTITAQNRGSVPAEAYICARGQGLRCELNGSPIHLQPGEHGWISLTVRSEKRHLFGDPSTTPFEISCLTTSSSRTSSTLTGRFVQQSLIPLWSVLAVAAFGLVLGLVLAFALPSRTTVPSVTGAQSGVEAELILQEAGLVLGNRFGRRLSEVQLGTVLAQVPRAGTEVDKDSPVSIVVAAPEPDAVPTSTESTGIQGNTLIAILPASFRERCQAVAGAPPTSIASIYCINSSGIELFAYRFASQADLEESYAARVSASGATPDSGECGVDAVAERSVVNESGDFVGRVLCTVDDQGNPLVIWRIDGRLLQLEARSQSASDLIAWGETEGRTLILIVPSPDSTGGSDSEISPPPEPVTPQEPSAPDDSPQSDDGAEDQPSEPILPAEEDASSENSESAQMFLDAVFNERDSVGATSLLAEDYVEHNPAVSEGEDGVLLLIASLQGTSGELVDTRRIVESDEFVAVHSTYALNSALEPEDGAESIGVDIFRFDDDGLIAERWSVAQDASPSETNGSGRTMVDGGGDPAANQNQDDNISVVRRLYEDVLQSGDAAQLDDFVIQNHAEHNLDARDGSSRFNIPLAEGPIAVEPKRIVAQGDLVFVHAHFPEAPLGDKAAVDIYRLDGGLIVEHWDVQQPTVSAAESASGNDMFSQLS